MTPTSSRRRGRLVAMISLVGLLFWLTSVMASAIPGLLVLGVNVHSLALAGYAGESGVALAPLSQRIIGEATDDTTRAAASAPSQSPSPSGNGSDRPGISTPTSASPPVPAPTASGSASPTPTAAGSPAPSASPSASPSILPVPSILPSPTPLPSILPGPSPTPTPTVAKGTILGQVIDTVSHLPIVGATVTVSTNGAMVASATSDINGNVTFNLDPGAYTVTGSAAGYNSASQAVSLNGGGRVSVTLKLLSLAATGGIKGTVTNNAKQPVAVVGATLTLSSGLTAVTDIYGDFSFPVVPYGTYTLRASALGYLSQSQSVTVQGGHTTVVNFALAP